MLATSTVQPFNVCLLLERQENKRHRAPFVESVARYRVGTATLAMAVARRGMAWQLDSWRFGTTSDTMWLMIWFTQRSSGIDLLHHLLIINCYFRF
ncbi:hypothetical protein J6590_076330 [Homalodisca vitripennis]|nr:hypothetical protein J6590_076330 [Homalodisca vitripennis]